MKLAIVRYDVVNAYDGVAVEIYISGCNRQCVGCHSPELQDYGYGDTMTEQVIDEILFDLNLRNKFYDIVSFLGGDPLQQVGNKFQDFVTKIKASLPNKKLWLFTGEDDINKIPLWVWEYFDTVKVGSYQEKLKQDGFPASSNQRILKRGVDF